jgi:hypothetical protein
MSGMQDVATLATRYQELESTAHKLRSSIDKMQREVNFHRFPLRTVHHFTQTSDSYELVKSRTMELERIHETSIILKQLRQFNHAKAQLDHYTKEAKDLSGVKGLCPLHSCHDLIPFCRRPSAILNHGKDYSRT